MDKLFAKYGAPATITIMTKYIGAMVILLVMFFAASDALAKGSSSRGGGSRTSSVRTSTSKPSTSKPSTPKPSQPVAPTPPKVTTKPSATTVTKVAAVAPVAATGKKMSTSGKVVDGTYKPKLSGGYTPPPGSTVYYPQSTFMSWLPFYALLAMQSHRDVVVQTPDGKEQTTKEEGVDTMYVLNWIITILFGIGLIALIVWFVNRKTNTLKYV